MVAKIPTLTLVLNLKYTERAVRRVRWIELALLRVCS